MQTSTYEIALIAGGFTIIGALIGGWIGYRNALRIYNVSEFNKAATIFQNTFFNELIFLKHNAVVGKMGSTDNLGECLRAGYVARHLKAYEVFKTYLSHRKKKAIDLAWNEYCNFNQYAGKNNEAEQKALALHRIEKLLEFSKHK